MLSFFNSDNCIWISSAALSIERVSKGKEADDMRAKTLQHRCHVQMVG